MAKVHNWYFQIYDLSDSDLGHLKKCLEENNLVGYAILYKECDLVTGYVELRQSRNVSYLKKFNARAFWHPRDFRLPIAKGYGDVILEYGTKKKVSFAN